jgi:pyruvate kinase
LELKEFLKENNAEHIKIISKIESEEAIENIDDIIEFSDGLMIARGDL